VKIAPLFLAVASLLTGCLLSKPTVHTESFRNPGRFQRSFSGGAAPALVAENIPENTDVLLRVRSVANDKIVTSRKSHTGTKIIGPNFDERADPFGRVVEPLRGLGNGSYVAELWVGGKLVDLQEFSVNGAADVSDDFSLAHPLDFTSRTGRLDQLIELTSAQRAEADRVFAHEKTALEVFAPGKERATKGVSIRQDSRAQIRALLTPSQQEIYDRTPQRLGGASLHDPDNPPRLARNEMIALLKNSPALTARLGTD
jgi:hypothetical protein